jgi:hypothetical protein
MGSKNIERQNQIPNDLPLFFAVYATKNDPAIQSNNSNSDPMI